MEFPKDVEKELMDIAKKGGIEADELKKEYEEFFGQDWLHSDGFVDDEDRHQYCLNKFFKDYSLRPPTSPYTIIPVGLDPVKTSAKGTIHSSIFIINSKGKLERISLLGEIVDLTTKVNLWCKYENVKLGSFQDGGDLIADNRANFKNPIQISASSRQIIDKLKLEYTTIAEAGNHLSKKGSDGYTIKTDWKIVRGTIMGSGFKSVDNPHDEMGNYRISDRTIDPNEERVTPEGDVLRPGMAVWISPKLMKFPADAQVDFIGLLDKSTKTGEVSMNACSAVSVHVPPKGE